jgi:hypothetical protein
MKKSNSSSYLRNLKEKDKLRQQRKTEGESGITLEWTQEGARYSIFTG